MPKTTVAFATITATAVNAKGVMKDRHRDDIIETLTSSTDLPDDVLGEAVGAVLRAAWVTGIDPAVEPGFHIKVEFS